MARNTFKRDMRRLSKEINKSFSKRLLRVALKSGTFLMGNVQKEISGFTSKSKWVKTGNLMRSWRLAVEGPTSRGLVISSVFSDLPYARIHDGNRTTIIRPKKGKYLAQPLTRRARVLGSPRNWDGGRDGKLHPIVLVPGRKILLVTTKRQGSFLKRRRRRKGARRRKGRHTKVQPQFLLRRETKIKGKDYSRKAMRRAEPTITRYIQRAMKDALTFGHQKAGRRSVLK